MSSSGERFTDVDLGDKRLPACYGYITWKLLPLDQAVADLRDSLPEINEFVKFAKKHCTFPNEHMLDKDEAAAIYLYTMEMSEDKCVYRILNQALRQEDRSKVRPWFAYLKLLNCATSKLPKVKDTVWRGIDKDVTQSFKKGQKITWWSISSCSASVDVISTFLGKVPHSTLFNIQCSTGKSISAYTCYPSENEVILMPGTTFKVVADPFHHQDGLHIIHLKEIAEDDDDNDNAVEQKGSMKSLTSDASATDSTTQKLANINLGEEKS
ncbi:unnamed protein product [Adineta steineri]|uniref:NAD(P)(+)--arginine ADP-ribosyltransferase n=1 Tax=Adineta steineri TaxID=433720 RepID=A0A814TTG3_9BILA|nr:unnamed protein product [Adineta steineri]CAF3996378.1 unnamed protein product [Adineta steineri]